MPKSRDARAVKRTAVRLYKPNSEKMENKVSKQIVFIIVMGILLLSFNNVTKSQVTYYAAPAAKGNGDGSSAANAAEYLNRSLWKKVRDGLNTNSVTVWLCNGVYNSGTLNLSLIGDPMHMLTVRAEKDYQVVMIADSSMAYILNLRGAENILVRGMIFKGPVRSFAVACFADGKRAAKNLIIENCKFLDLEKAKFGGLLLNEASNIVVRGCTFNNVGIGGGAHMIYSNTYSRDLSVIGCSFSNCKGDYVRFRNGTGFVKVDSCNFSSNNLIYNNEFILVPLFNDVNPGDEFFATDFQFTNNKFSYDVAGRRRHAIQFRCDGYNVPTFDGLDYNVAEKDSNILNHGTASQKAAILGPKMGLDNSKIKIYGNHYFNVDYEVVYWHHPNYGSKSEGYTGFCNLSNWPSTSGEVASAPIIINGNFEMKGYYLRNWNKTGVAPLTHKGLNDRDAINRVSTGHLNDGKDAINRVSTAVVLNSQELFQWLNNAPDKWTMDCLFAVGVSSGPGIKFRIDVGHNELKDSRISIAINSRGQVGIYNDSSFIALPSLGKIRFSIDSNADKNYSGTGDQLKWYHLQITGNYSIDSPFADISLSEENTMPLKRFAKHVNWWVNGAPVKNTKPVIINFYTNACDVIVDEVQFK